jgi:hypothetical protein
MMGELSVMGEVIERRPNHVEQNRLKRIYERHELEAEQRNAWKIPGERIALLLSPYLGNRKVMFALNDHSAFGPLSSSGLYSTSPNNFTGCLPSFMTRPT